MREEEDPLSALESLEFSQESSPELPELLPEENPISKRSAAPAGTNLEEFDASNNSLEISEEPIADLEEFALPTNESDDLENLLEDDSDDLNTFLDTIDESPINESKELKSIEYKLDTLDKISEQSLEQLDNLMEIVQKQNVKSEE